MTSDDIKKYEERLLVLRDELSREIKDVIRDTTMGEESDTVDKESDEAEERGTVYAEQIVLKERLNAVLDALHKIKNGGYGACETCGSPIEQAILDIDPESKQCKACKQKKAS